MYEGPERRMNSALDHDLLIKIESDTDHLVRAFGAHVQEDKDQFSEIKKGQGWLMKGAWVLTGIFIAFEIWFKLKG